MEGSSCASVRVRLILIGSSQKRVSGANARYWLMPRTRHLTTKRNTEVVCGLKKKQLYVTRPRPRPVYLSPKAICISHTERVK